MKYFFTISLILLAIFGFSQSNLLSFSGYKKATALNEPVRAIDDRGLEGIHISYHFDDAAVINKTEKNDRYQVLAIKNFSHLQEVGKPALPSHIDLVAIPEGADYELTIQHDIALVKNNYRIYPALQPARDTEGAPEPEFEIDRDFYKKDQIYPAEPIRIREIIRIRGLRYAMVEITPIQYNPATGQIFMHENLTYELRFKGASHFMDYRQHSKSALDYMSNFPLNAQSLKSDIQQYAGNQGIMQNTGNAKNYIIITHANFLAAADSLARWKRQLGYSVEVVSQSSWTSAQVDSTVHALYNNWTPKPDYLLIMGDHQFVPAKVITNSGGNQFGTDLYYVCMDGTGDYVPDMAKGRISANTAADALLQVSKIINYERNPVSDSSFYQNGLNCAQYQDDDNNGYADRRFAHTSEDIRNYTTSKGYAVQRIYYTASNVNPTYYNNGYYSPAGTAIPNVLKKSNGFNWNGGSTDIKNAINAGKFYVFHRDHGYSGGSGWAHPYFTNSKIGLLNNGDKLPVVFSINCHTGEFTLNSCFAETFMRKSNGGAVGVVAASYYSYSGYNDGLSIGMIDAIWSNPGLVPVFGNGGINNPGITPHTDIVTMGDVLNHGLIREVQTWGGNNTGTRYTHELFHYFGDPAMRIWTEQPQQLTANFDTTFNCTDTALVISNCNDSNAIVTLTDNNQLLARIQLVNGNGSIPLFNLQGMNFTLTISARDMRPLIKPISKGSGGQFGVYNVVSGTICMNDSNGSIEVIPSCGTPPFHISWTDGDTNFLRNNLPAGTYIYTVQDSANTVLTDTIIVTGPSAALSVSGQTHDAKCYYTSSGSIILTTQGGYSPYSYQWSNGATSQNLSNLSANTYTVTVTDSAGCQTQQTFVINQPPALSLNIATVDDATGNCSGSATANVSGGVTPYTYLWNDPGAQTTATATNLCAGIYQVKVLDSNQCESYKTTVIYNSVGINTATNEVEIGLYPNPSESGIFTLSLNTDMQHSFILKVYNNLGKLIYSRTIEVHGKHSEVVDLSHHAGGIYYLQIQDEEHILDTRNLIIK
jgi:hypothetical protein